MYMTCGHVDMYDVPMDRKSSSLVVVGLVSKSLIESDKFKGFPLKNQILDGFGNPDI